MPHLNSVEPQLFVADIQRSCDFYASRLGFAVAFVYGIHPTTRRSFATTPG